MLRLAFDFIITWRETRTRPNAYFINIAPPNVRYLSMQPNYSSLPVTFPQSYKTYPATQPKALLTDM